MTDHPDERSLRRPDFLGGLPLVLSDGQEWVFPRPRATPDHSHPGALLWTLEGVPDAGLGEALTEAALDFPDPATAGDSLEHQIGLAALILLRNYELTPDAVSELLVLGYHARGDNEGCLASMKAIWAGVLRPYYDDISRARAALPPVNPSGAGSVVGLN